ncbi:hypothetical protein [Streptomyces anulatus]|nr:hypothetical protein [Streptomyces anulatus]MCX4508661.1 hypothetical protein [Streptomyces anulatus]
MATGKTSEEGALALLEYESRSYRDLMRKELSTGALNLPTAGAR